MIGQFSQLNGDAIARRQETESAIVSNASRSFSDPSGGMDSIDLNAHRFLHDSCATPWNQESCAIGRPSFNWSAISSVDDLSRTHVVSLITIRRCQRSLKSSAHRIRRGFAQQWLNCRRFIRIRVLTECLSPTADGRLIASVPYDPELIGKDLGVRSLA